jgi:uncharacterized membrane protein
MTFLKELFILAVIFTVTDAFYLTSMSGYFNAVVRRVQGSPIQMDFAATVLCYIFLVGGLYYFIIRERRTWQEAGLLGVVIYGVYETTTKALLKNWDWLTVLLDTTWGGILFALSTALTYQLTK